MALKDAEPSANKSIVKKNEYSFTRKLLLIGGASIALSPIALNLPRDSQSENCNEFKVQAAEKLDGKQTRIVAIGDSLTSVEDGWIYNLKCNYFSEGKDIPEIIAYAKPGWTTHQVIQEFSNNTLISDQISQADVVVLEIGLNDLNYAKILHEKGQKCKPGEPEEGCLELIPNEIFRENLQIIIEKIKGLNTESIIIIPDIYYMRAQEEKNEGNFDTYNKYLVSMVNFIRSLDGKNGISVAEFYEDINGESGNESGQERGYLITDGHPNKKGSELIATRIYEAISSSN